MITPRLPSEEFWFYRVSAELTLALLHKINNELTGVVFQIESLQDLARQQAPEAPPGSSPAAPPELQAELEACAAALNHSVTSILGLLRQSVALQRAPVELPLQSLPLQSLLSAAQPVLRLILPRTLQLTLQAPASNPAIGMTEEDFTTLLCAAALLLHPAPSHPSGGITVSCACGPNAQVTLTLDTPPPNGLTPAEPHPLDPAGAAWQSFLHRVARLGARVTLTLGPSPSITLTLPGEPELEP